MNKIEKDAAKAIEEREEFLKEFARSVEPELDLA